jgi:hypothetical protein
MTPFKKIALAMLALGALPLPFQSAVAVTPAQQATHQTALRTNEASLVMLERTQARIEATKGDAARDALAVAYEEQQLRYVNAMQQQHDAAISVMRETLGGPRWGLHEQNLAQLNQFELLAQSHERRTQVLSQRADAMAAGRPLTFQLPVASPLQASTAILAAAHDYVFPPAQAMIALTVYNACKKDSSGNVNQKACAAAVAQGLVDSNAARVTFNSCWASLESVRPKWWRSVRRAGCTAALVARLA